MAKIEKHYKLTQDEIDYIEEIKNKHKLTYSTEALSLILREHKKGAEYDFVSVETYKNVLALMELMNSFYYIKGYESVPLYSRRDEYVESIDEALKVATKKIEREKNLRNFNDKKFKIVFED